LARRIKIRTQGTRLKSRIEEDRSVVLIAAIAAPQRCLPATVVSSQTNARVHNRIGTDLSLRWHICADVMTAGVGCRAPSKEVYRVANGPLVKQGRHSGEVWRPGRLTIVQVGQEGVVQFAELGIQKGC